jgi:hypothetical protein
MSGAAPNAQKATASLLWQGQSRIPGGQHSYFVGPEFMLETIKYQKYQKT